MTTGVRADWTEFAPRLSAAWQADEPDRLHQRRRGALVSADLSGFTAMSERLASAGKEGSERLTAIVNGCFEALISVAHHCGGDVLKFGGDALLIFFDGDEGAVHAARASAQMQRVIGASKFAKLGLKMSVGAHYGEFDLFLVGEPDWRELVLAGRSVTRTVELESDAEAGQVLASRELAARLPDGWVGRKNSGGVLLDVDAVPRSRSPVPSSAPPAGAELLAPSLREEVRALASLGGEHRIVTVVFVEVEGTDGSLEEAGPESFGRNLDALVRAAQSMQQLYGVQFLYTDVIADGIKLIATAGAPTSTVNDDEAALRAAVALVHGDPAARIKAGVNRGRVFAGFLGANDRHTYTVMGDPVNLAARLMARADPGQVVVSTEVIEASRAEIRSTPLPPFLVKGKSKPVTAVVVDEVEEGRRAAPALTELRLVGREQEVARLSALVADVADGRGRAVELIGDAGIGKSRLVAEVAGDERLFLRVTVECQPYDINTAYAAAKVVLRRVLGIRYSASAEEAGKALRRTIARVSPQLLPMLPLIAVPVDAVVPSTPEVDALSPDFVVDRTHDAILEVLSVMVATPSLLLVEDAYYADAASAALFSAIARAIGDRPWLLVATSRPETQYLLTGSDRVEQMQLEPLQAAAASELAAAALEGAPDAAELVAAAERGGGNPLFVLRLMEAVRAGVATEDLPESVERIVAERLDRLAPGDRTLLRYAAVLGARFDADLLGVFLTSTGQPEPDPAAWGRLEDLIETDDDHNRRFRHVLYRDVAYEGLPFGRRGRLHQRIGELLEASRHATDVALLAEHFFRAGDHERTWRYSVAAGDQAWKALAVREAAAAFQRALKVRPRIRGLTGNEGSRVAEHLGDALERDARYDEADAAYRSAVRLAAGRGPAATANLLLKRGVLRERVGKYAAALRWYERGRAGLQGSDEDSAVAALLVASAGVMHRMGRIEECLGFADQAADRAVSVGDQLNEAHACLLLTELEDGNADTARRYGERALALFNDLGDVLYQGKVLNNLGIVEYYESNWSTSAEHYELAAARFDAAGDVVEAASARNNLGEVYSDQGRLDDAVPVFEQALAVWTRAGYPIGCALARSNLGRAQARSEVGAVALENLRAALAEFTAIHADRFCVDTRLRLTEAYLLLGDTTAAQEASDEVAAQVAAGGGFPGSDAVVARLHCWLLRQQGRNAEAAEVAAEALELAERASARYERALVLNELLQLTGEHRLGVELKAEREALGVVRLPALPVPL